jgi:hypothetical protein
MANVDPRLHDHHTRRADPLAAAPQATTPAFPGVDPLANNDPTKTITPAARAAGLVLLAAGALWLAAHAVALVFLFL